MLKTLARDQLFKRLEKTEFGEVEIITPEGETRHFGGAKPGPKARMQIRDWKIISNLAANGDVGFAEDYRDGFWESDDLNNLIGFALSNKDTLDSYVLGNPFMRLMQKMSYLFRLNTLKGSKKNIHAHYDLGNAFYQLWLDPTMTYSSALYQSGTEDLAQAQHNKYDRILDRLNSNSGRVLEIGCGWGGFAERAAQKGDYALRGVTLSEEQHAYATERLKGKNAEIVLEDYRIQNGKFDTIVSIEMFEAVGEQYWKTYFAKLKALLKDKGKAVIQTITIRDEHFERYRQGGDFIRSYIFPGGMLPSPEIFRREAEKAELRVTNSHAFGQDYATTLLEWLHNFEAKTAEIKALGFDEPFMRLWRLYLAACAAGFRTERTDVYQFEVQHA